jgi:glycosyltransferase involved in cell wall biosynthesis
MNKVNNKKLKVGIFIDGGFIPSYDGATNRFQYLSRHLQKNGVDVVIFYCYRGWSNIELIKKEPFKTYLLSIDNYYNNLSLLASLIKKEGIGIIQFNDLEPILSYGIKLSNMTKTHLVAEMHYVVSNLAKSLGSSSEDIKNIKSYEKIVGGAIDHLICLSGDDKPTLLDNMDITDDKVSVIPSGVDVDNTKFYGPNFNEKTILFLGNLFFEPNVKALDNIYKYIYPKLDNFGFKFLIVGDCPKEIRNKYKGSNFEFTGTILDLNNVFKKSTIALSPVIEGTGMRIKTLNYLSAGLPVITTSISASGFNDKNVLIIEDDFNKYSDIIIDLINNKKSTLELSKNSRNLMEKKFNWDTIAKQTKATYEKILNNEIRYRGLSEKELMSLDLNKEPVWLEETRSKGRFADWPYALDDDFTYALIENNKINVIKK